MVRPQVVVPKPIRVTLRNFSLYDRTPEISAEFGPGVFCLAGANGLGKSTFIAALNYAITGIVPDPARQFDSVDEYYQYSIGYSKSFFRGRIAEGDRDLAEVELEMRVGEVHYRLVRGMFDPQGLRSFERDHIELDQVGISDADRHTSYLTKLVADTGMRSIAQIAFIQHFMLTFDERRQLLFWDPRIAQSALFLAFGVDLESAERSEILRRAVEKSDSQSRNLQWQATTVRGELQTLRRAAQATDTPDPDLTHQHQQLLMQQDRGAEEVRRIEQELGDVITRAAANQSALEAARSDYEASFAQQLATSVLPEHNRTVLDSLSSRVCQVCGSHDAAAITQLEVRLEAPSCPLCGSPVVRPRPGAAADLGVLDAEVNRTTQLVAADESAVTRLSAELAEATGRQERAEQQLRDFERQNPPLLLIGRNADALGAIEQRYRDQEADLLQRKTVALARRETAKAELRQLRQELAAAYATAEDRFVPEFSTLAREFLGLELDVELATSTSGAQLLLTVQGTRRRAQDMLSESQRFFLDIALRMAFAKQLSTVGTPACLYIDTPEGSLDIAYESRAGSMFGRFVADGYQIVMTANINTSQLLRKLARVCGPDRMTLLRMTDWTSLSEVQSAEEGLFNDAFDAIQGELHA